MTAPMVETTPLDFPQQMLWPEGALRLCKGRQATCLCSKLCQKGLARHLSS